MNSRFPALFSALGLFAATAFAQAPQIKILSAYYGRPEPEKSHDVKSLVESLLASGQTSFPVTRQSMGSPKLNLGRTNYLRVEYLFNGRKVSATASDGELFNLRGPGAGVASSGSDEAPLRVVNKLAYPIRVYSLDRWGRWSWGDQLPPGGVYSVNSTVSKSWVVTTARATAVIYEFKARRGDNRISIDENTINRTITR